jgi:hypothetical protein
MLISPRCDLSRSHQTHGNKGQMLSISPRFEAVNSCMKISRGVYSSPWSDSFAVDWWVCFRRQSTGFPRGSSKCRGVTLHKYGRRKARMGWGNFLARSKLTLKKLTCIHSNACLSLLYSVSLRSNVFMHGYEQKVLRWSWPDFILDLGVLND